ncbi:MAG: ATP phosphoribosyltransferase regulatory subunit [Firmicutes bacterium]|nr:ATP phosphoribosyltransferase regulatory subunit [Bacillota bacterium]
MLKNFIPEGVADLNYDEYEKIQSIENSLVKVFSDSGYRQIQTPTFEYFDLFASESVSAGTEDMYKIMDANGKMMVLRPDATIPIARMIATTHKRNDGEIKLMYVTNVYRSADFRAGERREFKQAGIEYFGTCSPETDANVIETAIKALSAAGFSDLKTELGDSNYFSGLLDELEKDGKITLKEQTTHLRELIETKNVPAIQMFADDNGIEGKSREVLLALPVLFGDMDDVITRATELALNDKMREAIENVKAIKEVMGDSIEISVDMGLVNRLEYYSGMIFKVYLKNTGVIVGSGGRYDQLMTKFGRDIPAVGFGLNVNTLFDALGADASDSQVLNIALGKGRLADTTVKQLQSIGIEFPDYSKESRKLFFTDSTGKFRIIFVKAVDVGIYVEKGACDVGVIGKDTLLESGSDVFEMLDLGFGKCKFAVAAPDGFKYDKTKKLRVATKYPNVAKQYFAKMGRSIEIIKINGSVELAPLIGLSDVIVDIVETGTTLKENGLSVVEEIADISARFIVNRASLKTKEKQVAEIMEALRERNQQ